MAPRRPGSRAILLGVGEYDPRSRVRCPDLVDLPGVKCNLAELGKVLTDEEIGVFGEEQVETVAATSHSVFIDALTRTVDQATDLLLFYYAGHAWVSDNGRDLFLTVADSHVGDGPDVQRLNVVSWEREVLPRLQGYATDTRHVIAVLDCCYAGNALVNLQSGRKSVSVLAAVQRNRRIPAGHGNECTPYTRELVRVLREGSDGGPVTVALLAHELAEAFRDSTTINGDEWCPQDRLSHGARDIALSHPVPRPDPDPWYLRLLHWVRDVLAPWGRGALRRLWALRRLVFPALAAAVLATGMLLWWGEEPSGCRSPLELRLLVDADARPTVQKVVDGFLTSEANQDEDGCRRNGVTVYEAKSTQAALFLSGGDPDALATQPDVWIPGATSTYDRAAAGGGDGAALKLLGPVAYTPVVVAAPDDLSFRQALRDGSRLAGILRTLREDNRDLTLLRADPEYTDPAQMATVALYGHHPPGESADSGDLSAYERAMAKVSPAPSTSHALMCTLALDGELEDRAVALVPEQTMVRFNLPPGDPGRPGCASAALSNHTALYPADVPVLQHPFVHVTWQRADRDAEQRKAAVRRLHAWFTGDSAQRTFVRDGYRGVAGDGPAAPGEDSPLNGPSTLRNPTLAGEAPAGEAVERTLTRYRAILGSGRVLYLLDASSSMRRVWDGPGGAKAVLSESLESLGPGDRYGIWSVASEPEAASAHRDVAAFGEHRGPEVEKSLRNAGIREQNADIGRALEEALDHLAADARDEGHPRMIVLITDGEDSADVAAGRRAALLERIRREEVPVVVVALRSGGCAEGEFNREIATGPGSRCLPPSGEQARELRDEVARAGTGDAR